MGVIQQSCLAVTVEHLDFVAVAARAEQELSIGCDIELSGMGIRRLIAETGEQTCLVVNGENSDAFGFQSIAGIEEPAIGTQMDVGTATGSHAVGRNLLKCLQSALAVSEDGDFARQLAHQIGETTVATERQVTGTGVGSNISSHAVGYDLLSLNAIRQDAIGAEIRSQHILSIGREAGAMHVRCILTAQVRSTHCTKKPCGELGVTSV